MFVRTLSRWTAALYSQAAWIPASFLVLATLWGSLTTLLNAGPFRVRPATSKTAVGILPQGWAFFTRDPREKDILPFHLRARKATPVWAVDVRGFAWKGVNRRSRAYSRQVGHLLPQIPPAAWSACTVTDGCEALFTDAFTTVTNPYPDPLVCGSVVLVQVEHLPWAWYPRVRLLRRPEKRVQLQVQCPARTHTPGNQR